VIAPVAVSAEGQTLNVNADTFASALAAALKAKRLLLLTDVAGVLDKDKKLIDDLTVAEARGLIRNGTITGGMIPKVEGCIEVVEAGVEAVVIIDGRVPHCVLLELFTEHGVGTIVRRERE
jgi:acetylglutamate kinase